MADKVKDALEGAREAAPSARLFALPNTRWAIVGALLLVFASRVLVLLVDPERLADRSVIKDDAFYYLEIVRHFVLGQGMSWDGIEPTNAFHPLHAGVQLIAMFLTGVSGSGPLWALMVGGTLLSVAAAALMERLAFRRGAGGWSSLLLATCPTWWISTFNGLETMLAVVCALIVVDAHDRWLRGEAVRPVVFGALCGFALLARSDLALLVGPLIVHRFWHVRRAGQRLEPSLVVAFGVVWGTWLVASYWATGSVLPSSGAAQRAIATGAGWPAVQGVLPFDTAATVGVDNVPLTWTVQVGVSLILLALLHPILAPLSFDVPPSVYARDLLDWWLVRAIHEWPWLLGAVALATAVAALAAYRHSRGADGLVWPIVLWWVLFCAGYTFYAPAAWFFDRYLTVPAVVVTPLMLGVIAASASGRRRPFAVGWLVLAALVGAAGAIGTLKPTIIEPHELDAHRFRAVAQRLNRTLAPGTVIAGFQTGALSWYYAGPVVNLDGKMSMRTRRLRQQGRLATVICERGAALLVDEAPGITSAIASGALPPTLLAPEPLEAADLARIDARRAARAYPVVGCPGPPDGGATRQPRDPRQQRSDRPQIR